MAICHSVGVATHESRDALQRDKQSRHIGLKYNNIWYSSKVLNFYSGICWLKQCKVPKPQIKSMALIPMISLSGKQSAMMFKAILSFESLKVGTKTQLFKIRKLA